MEVITTNAYKSFDGMSFSSKEECMLYEESYLTDEQLIDCFHFFHFKHNNLGNLDTARRPSDATFYEFKITRSTNVQEIKLYYKFRTYPSREICTKYTRLGFRIKNNFDFVVLQDAVKGYDEVHYEKESTYKIKMFYNFLDELKSCSLKPKEKEFDATQAQQIIDSLQSHELEKMLEKIKKTVENNESVLHVYTSLEEKTILSLKNKGFRVITQPSIAIQKDNLYYSIYLKSL